MTSKKLLIATHNQGKVRELGAMLAEWEGACVSLTEAGVDFDVEETGTTFVENAILKGEAYARATGLWTLAEDSGLEVAALDGVPGVYTARYGGPGLSHEERYQHLLAEMGG
ncbi:MAG TPA: non-canonical purine NTP pyrophosphatase, partial [Anaerolineae bacterium]|nr:non-canonical purine NTP pyrophosphatase [Anaerolineae bacterium]